MSNSIEAFIIDYLKEIEDNNAAIFAGAGLSAASGHVDWKTLLKDIANDLGLQIDKEDDLVSLAQYHLNKNANNRHQLNQKLIEEFSSGKKPNPNHEVLSRLPIRTYWTTNYDRLIEKSLENANKIVDAKYTIPHLAKTVHRRDAVVYKMHGDIEHPDEAILVKDQYEKYFQTHAPYINALSGDLISKTFLFIGFSFTDPNLDQILSRIRITYKTNQRHHYCIFRKIKQGKDESSEEFDYKKIKQALVIEDLKRFNIRVLLIDEYSQIADILNELERRYKQKTVYISGSAHEYGKWSKDNGESWIAELSKKLIQNNNKIVSGFGLGVGSAVITGVLEEIYLNKKELLKDQLLLRPFPQGEKGKEQWSVYRHDMILYSGIAIFIFGNKIVNENIEIAKGVKEEFDIAHKQNVFLIPVGATGYAAKELWNTVTGQIDKYYPSDSKLKELILELGNDKLNGDELIELIIKIINYINKSI